MAIKNKEEINELFQNDITDYKENDLWKFENERKLIANIEKATYEILGEMEEDFKKLEVEFDDKQKYLIQTSHEKFMIFGSSVNLNKYYRKELGILNNKLVTDVVELMGMETAFGRIFLTALLKKSQLQSKYPVKISEKNIRDIIVREDAFFSKLKPYFKHAYNNNKPLIVDTGHNFKEAVKKIEWAFSENNNQAIIDILYADGMRQYVKDNEEIYRAALKYIGEENADVIKLYFGLDSVRPYSYEEIANMMDCKVGRVLRLFEKGIKLMKGKCVSQPELYKLFGYEDFGEDVN